MEAPEHLRLQRQTEDAAKRLNRTTGKGCITAVLNDSGGGDVGLAFSVEGLRTGQVEKSLLILLSALARQLEAGVAEGCADCVASFERVLNAMSALRPQPAHEEEACGICQVAFVEGDNCLTDINLGDVHAACCGPERESYVNLDTGEPLRDGEPIPTPWRWCAPAPARPAHPFDH